MAISFSRPDPSEPSAVASASFTTSRKGYEQAEVREFLRMVAAELARLQEREKFLERELRTSQRSGPTASVALDEEVVTRMLGEEAARILSTAREAANQIRARAEDGAARLLREAGDEAQRLRAEAEIEAARRRTDAAADAESELEMAKQQGREMVNEARAYRERVLSELARRRELARQQIEQLVHGRDRLLQAFERARTVAVDVMAELTPLGEPAEYVDLSPTTGPVPIVVPRRDPPPPVADVTVEISEPEVADDAAEPVHLDLVSDDTASHAVVLEINRGGEEADVDEEALDDTVAATADVAPVIELFADQQAPDETTAIELSEERDATIGTERDATIGTERDATIGTEHDAAVDDGRDSVDDLFARLRAARSDGVAQRVADEVAAPTPLPVEDHAADDSVFKPTPDAPVEETTIDDTPFARRDAALTPLIVAAARKLKRVLADEQNDVLHRLRRKEVVRDVDALLPAIDDHAMKYGDSIASELSEAARAGAESMGGAGDVDVSAASSAASAAIATDLLAPLRDRVARSVSDANGDNGELASLVRVVYREWKSQRIDEHLDDVLRVAFGRGALAAAGVGSPITWIVDPNGPACPDAEDNALAGIVMAGEPFPTDHVCAPAHHGCTCMIAPAPPAD